MSKKGIILMLGATIAAGFAGYKVGSKKHYCSLCDGPELELEDDDFDSEEIADDSDLEETEAEAEARRILSRQMLGEIRDHGTLPKFRKLDQEGLDELLGKVRPELLAYIMCCGSDD
ncbi:hypothetical protein [Fusicatenibacter sp.]